MVKRCDVVTVGGNRLAKACTPEGRHVDSSDYAALQASHDRMLREMTRFATVIERANGEPLLWIKLTDGTGVATPNAYIAAIAAAQPFTET